MNATPTSAGSRGHSLQPRFVLVNNCVPRMDANCALCCAKIERGYLRDPQTASGPLKSIRLKRG
jgi:hypothetical protein